MNRPLKIALLGYGRMGRLIERIVQDSGHSICARFSKKDAFIQNPLLLQDFIQADVCIDFSHAECLLHHLQLCIEYHKPLVIGTTGWEKESALVESLIKSSSIGCIYSPNFSIGLALFNEIVGYSARKAASLQEYDICGVEHHHNQKIDSPSGTAKALINTIQQSIPSRDPITFSSIRCGYTPGTHTIHIEGPIDSITLTHTARNRDGFALGAITEAQWILDKKGFFTMQDLLQHIFPELINA